MRATASGWISRTSTERPLNWAADASGSTPSWSTFFFGFERFSDVSIATVLAKSTVG